jgi:hypothetical protein
MGTRRTELGESGTAHFGGVDFVENQKCDEIKRGTEKPDGCQLAHMGDEVFKKCGLRKKKHVGWARRQ